MASSPPSCALSQSSARLTFLALSFTGNKQSKAVWAGGQRVYFAYCMSNTQHHKQKCLCAGSTAQGCLSPVLLWGSYVLCTSALCPTLRSSPNGANFSTELGVFHSVLGSEVCRQRCPLSVQKEVSLPREPALQMVWAWRLWGVEARGSGKCFCDPGQIRASPLHS